MFLFTLLILFLARSASGSVAFNFEMAPAKMLVGKPPGAMKTIKTLAPTPPANKEKTKKTKKPRTVESFKVGRLIVFQDPIHAQSKDTTKFTVCGRQEILDLPKWVQSERAMTGWERARPFSTRFVGLDDDIWLILRCFARCEAGVGMDDLAGHAAKIEECYNEARKTMNINQSYERTVACWKERVRGGGTTPARGGGASGVASTSGMQVSSVSTRDQKVFRILLYRAPSRLDHS